MSRRNLRAVAAGLLVLAVLCGSAAAPLERATAGNGCPPAGQLDDNEQSEPGHGDGTDPGGLDPDGESAARFAVSYAAGPGGAVTGDLAQRIAKGADATAVTAVADAGYRFVDWSDGVTTAGRHDRNVTAAIDVEARFAVRNFDLNYRAGPHGTLGGATSQSVARGDDGTAVTAVPDAGYDFVRWSDGVTDNPRTDLNVAGDLDVTAEFAIQSFRARYLAGAGGTITGDADQRVPFGADASPVTATPDTGYRFVQWNDGSVANPRTDGAFAADLTATAEFARLSYRLLYSAGVGGSLTGDLDQNLLHGDDGTAVTAVPDAHRHFLRWSDGVTDNPRTDLGVTGALTVVAVFQVNSYSLVYTAGPNGSVSPNTPQSVEYQSDGAAVTATPNTGYRFVRWSDGVTDNPRTDEMVAADLSVTAEFAVRSYQVSYLAGAGGTIGGTASQSVDHGSSATAVTAVPDAGQHFVQWSDGVTDNPRTDLNVTADLEVTAQFARNSYTLTYTAGSGGSLTGTGTQSVVHGSDGTAVTAVPDADHYFVRWSDGSTANPRTDVGITANLNVAAEFASAVTLGVGDPRQGVVGSSARTLRLRNSGVAAGEYLLVPTNTGASSRSLAVALSGNAATSATTASGGVAATADPRATLRSDAVALAQAQRGTSGSGTPLTPAAGIAAGVVPAPGDIWRLNRGVDQGCATGAGTDARVVAVTDHAIVVVDTDNPAGGQTDADLQGIATVFEESIYPSVTAAFGAPSDRDGNDRVVIFVTRGLNELSPPASSVVVDSLTRPVDLLAQDECAMSNQGEVIYLVAADPNGAINSNVRTLSFVEGVAGPSLARQLTTLIADGARLDADAPLDASWLIHALAEHGVERTFYARSEGLTPGMNIILSMLTTGPYASKRVAAFNAYANSSFGTLRVWLRAPQVSGLFNAAATDARRGVGWAFLRYAADRYAAGSLAREQEFFASLVAGTATPSGIFADVTGAELDEWYRDFNVALFVDDEPSAGSLGTEGRYAVPSWNFRSVYGGLGGFPLAVEAMSVGGSVNGAYAAGGGSRYLRFAVAPGQVATITFTPGWSDPSEEIGYTLVRLS